LSKLTNERFIFALGKFAVRISTATPTILRSSWYSSLPPGKCHEIIWN
jgi:hypothetical protein